MTGMAAFLVFLSAGTHIVHYHHLRCPDVKYENGSLKHLSAKSFIRSSSKLQTECPRKNFCPVCGCCGGAIGSIVSVFKELHWSGFNLEFEILHESIRHVAADIW